MLYAQRARKEVRDFKSDISCHTRDHAQHFRHVSQLACTLRRYGTSSKRSSTYTVHALPIDYHLSSHNTSESGLLLNPLLSWISPQQLITFTSSKMRIPLRHRSGDSRLSLSHYLLSFITDQVAPAAPDQTAATLPFPPARSPGKSIDPPCNHFDSSSSSNYSGTGLASPARTDEQVSPRTVPTTRRHRPGPIPICPPPVRIAFASRPVGRPSDYSASYRPLHGEIDALPTPAYLMSNIDTCFASPPLSSPDSFEVPEIFTASPSAHCWPTTSRVKMVFPTDDSSIGDNNMRTITDWPSQCSVSGTTPVFSQPPTVLSDDLSRLQLQSPLWAPPRYTLMAEELHITRSGSSIISARTTEGSGTTDPYTSPSSSWCGSRVSIGVRSAEVPEESCSPGDHSDGETMDEIDELGYESDDEASI